MKTKRRYPIGAEVQPAGGTHFLVWAPRPGKVELVLESGPGAPAVIPMKALADGYHGAMVPVATAGTRYRFRLDGKGDYPDPASRFQPDGPHGSSQVVDPTAYDWQDAGWPGVSVKGQVIYEMHVGTFTKEGTFAAAQNELAELAACGITVVEVMPVADFPGRFGWGYDGVGQFAPVWLYGEPDDFRRFVDTAHQNGLGVILDVVYNHFGPSGNYLKEYSTDYFTDAYKNEWGEAINFDGKNSRPVREFFLANAAYWIEEFHLDGLRLDATQQIFDASPEYIVTAIARRVRKAAAGRQTILVAENEPQDSNLVRPATAGGNGLDSLWNDDFHHSAMVALTGRNEAYYTDYLGKPQEFLSMLKYGYLYQGQRYKWQKGRRGSPGLDLPPEAFVLYIQNHDQIANSGRSERLQFLTSPGRLRAMTALLLLAPGTPMLFQGQEFGASTPFYYFSDHDPELAKLVREGRAQFTQQFRSLATPEMQSFVKDPGNPSVFEQCKLDLGERERHRPVYDLHKDLLRLRREDPVFSAQAPRGLDGAVVAEECLVLRYFGQEGDDRLLVVNFGRDVHLDPAPEPLLAPPAGMAWGIVWSSEDPKYGGTGTPHPDTQENWRMQGHAAVALAPVPREDKKDA
ncbi:malto-oligosyltrehalose trehalohydrolase [Solidesulfovibrio carbinoliphilus]|nr:malto-oligosyltrehalose trehalohydrolase [Solidesulfovibrio carbinoliphilus]